MTFRRHTFIVFLLLAAVVYLFFSPLLPAGSVNLRNHSRTNPAMVVPLAMLQAAALFSFLYLVSPSERTSRSACLIDLHCARLC